jgi:hypothetical protein
MRPTKISIDPTVPKLAPGLLALLFVPALANAGEPPPAPMAPPPVESLYKFSGYLEAGIMGNFDDPSGHTNYGRLFDDRANEPMLNQLSLTLEKVFTPAGNAGVASQGIQNGGFDWGFKVQGLVGSDARFIHSLGLLDHASDSLIQFDIPEAYLNFHFPILTEGGVDLKLGKFVTLEGAETINPLTNVFYSHSYIFNFGIPFNHTGALFTMHANPNVDIYAGITRGVNTSIDDNNDAWAFHGGIGLVNCDDGKFSLLASTAIGAETPGNNHDVRYLNDLTASYKITDKLTSVTDLNYAYDELAKADAFGVAQYFTYAVNDKVALSVRGEVFRDGEGFYVTQYRNFGDPVRGLEGAPFVSPGSHGAGESTYLAVTAGLTYKVCENFLVRPEVRWDHSTAAKAFNNFSDNNMVTLGVDAILHF